LKHTNLSSSEGCEEFAPTSIQLKIAFVARWRANSFSELEGGINTICGRSCGRQKRELCESGRRQGYAPTIDDRKQAEPTIPSTKIQDISSTDPGAVTASLPLRTIKRTFPSRTHFCKASIIKDLVKLDRYDGLDIWLYGDQLRDEQQELMTERTTF
jgi:hypothetical protein